jgi:SH3-like domain-containing protein
MKRYLVLVVAVLLMFGTTLAQDNQTIVLNDATPGVDLAVSMSPDTAGAISLQLSGAMVTVKDATGQSIFNMNDSRVHALQLHFAPSASPHTITVERLPGVQEAYLSVVSQADMTYPTGTALTASPSLTVGQEFDTPLSSSSPGANLSVAIPPNTIGNLTASFPGSLTTAQVTDASGTPVATLDASQIDGLSLALDSGNYQIALLNQAGSASSVAGVSVTSAQPAPLPAAVMTPASAPSTVVLPEQTPCTIQIAQSSINLRSGPGTGYSILGYAYRADNLTVAGINPEQNWVLVSNGGGTGAWMSKQLGTLSGDCGQLQTYNIPFRNAQPPQVIIQNLPAQSAPSVNPPIQSNVQPQFGEEHDDHHEGSGDD